VDSSNHDRASLDSNLCQRHAPLLIRARSPTTASAPAVAITERREGRDKRREENDAYLHGVGVATRTLRGRLKVSVWFHAQTEPPCSCEALSRSPNRSTRSLWSSRERHRRSEGGRSARHLPRSSPEAALSQSSIARATGHRKGAPRFFVRRKAFSVAIGRCALMGTVTGWGSSDREAEPCPCLCRLRFAS
jgi:hypothetical protein